MMASRWQVVLHKRYGITATLMAALAAGLFGYAITGPPDERRDADISERQLGAAPDTGIALSLLENGSDDARRVLFVHGTPGRADAWSAFIASPPDGVHAIAVDRPGFGKTRPRRAEPSLAMQARALAPLLLAPDGQRPILVGHSLGGPIVAAAAALFPDKIGGLIIVAGSLDPALEEIYYAQLVADLFPFAPLLPRAVRNTNREILALEAELDWLKPRLGEITQPVTIIHGTDDTLVPYENVSFMESAFSSAPVTVVRLDGNNHFLPWNSEDVIRKAISEMLAKLAAG